MSENIRQDAPVPDNRAITVNGKKYHSATANLCPQCSADGRYMFIKMRLSNSDVVLECPACDYYITVNPSMVNRNLDNPK